METSRRQLPRRRLIRRPGHGVQKVFKSSEGPRLQIRLFRYMFAVVIHLLRFRGLSGTLLCSPAWGSMQRPLRHLTISRPELANGMKKFWGARCLLVPGPCGERGALFRSVATLCLVGVVGCCGWQWVEWADHSHGAAGTVFHQCLRKASCSK